MDFSKVKAITIPEGNVIKLEWNGFILWQKLLASLLPKEYQELEYISSYNDVGTYIDLGFSFDTKAKIHLTQAITYMSDYLGYIFGAAENSGVYRCMLTSPYKGNGGASLYGSTGSAFNVVVTAVVENADNEFEMTLKQGKLELKNVTYNNQVRSATNQTSYTMTNNLYLFAQNYNGSTRFGVDRTIKKFKYYDKNDELICDLIPCYRKIDNKIGMYDLAKKKFFKNIGVGEFIARHGDNPTNLLSWATNTDGTIYNGIGYKDTTRLSLSNGGNTTSAASKAMCASGFIPVKVGDVIRIKGSAPVSGISSYIMTYNPNKTFVKHNAFGQSSATDGNYWGTVGVTWYSFINDTLIIPITEENFGTDIAYFRFSCHMDENTIVTVNQEIPNLYLNAISYSTDTDGTIYNGVGYKENMYLSDGVPATKKGIDCTGFIPIDCGTSNTASGEQVIRFKNTSCDKTNNTRIALYTPSKNLIQTLYGTHLDTNGYNIAIPHETDANGNLTYVDLTAILAHIRDVATMGTTAYIRICSPNIDSNSIITINQEILNTCTNLAKPLPNNVGEVSKWVNGYRFSSSGITAQEGTTLSNPIPCKNGDIIKIKGVNLRENADRLSIYIFRQDIQEYGWSHGYYNVGVDLGGNIVTELLSHKDGVYTFKLLYNTPHIISSLRFAMPTPTDPSQVIITVNEEIPKDVLSITWTDDRRLSTSDGVLRNDITGYTVSDQIDLSVLKNIGDELVVTGLSFDGTTYPSRSIAGYKNKAFITAYYPSTTSTHPIGDSGVTIMKTSDTSNTTIIFKRTSKHPDLTSYTIALCGYGKGANAVVTHYYNDIKPEEEVFNNWVPYSTEDDDITIYNNGLGYKDGYRVRSGGGEAENNYATATGYIPVKAGDVVRVKGAEFLAGGTENAINVYDENLAVLGQMVGNSSYGIFQKAAYANYNYSSVVENPEGVFTWVVPPHADIRYMRVTARTLINVDSTWIRKDGLIVTVNEYQSGNLFDQNDPNIVLGARINSSGTAVAYQDGQLVTGWIEAKVGDVFTITSDKSNLTNDYTGMCGFYKGDTSHICQVINYADHIWTWSDDNLTGKLVIPSYMGYSSTTYDLSTTAYVRFCIPYTDINSIVITKR